MLFFTEMMLEEYDLKYRGISPRTEEEWRITYIYNCYLDSFIIHFRCLVDFFFSEKPRKDDITAQDFLDWELPTELRPQMKDWKEKAHKYVAHITESRKHNEMFWPYVEMVNALKPNIDQFLKETGRTIHYHR